MDTCEKYSEQALWQAVYDVNSKLSVSGIFSKIETLADYFLLFIEYGDDFYDYLDIGSTKESDHEADELAIMLLDSYITQLYLNIPAMLLYLRRQEPEYLGYINEVLIPKVLPKLTDAARIDKETRYKIYDSEIADKINDTYLTLKYVLYVLENLEVLIHSTEDPLGVLRQNSDYNHVSLPQKTAGLLTDQFDKMQENLGRMREDLEKFIVEIQAGGMRSEKINWLGTSTELAYMFEQLAYRGYIENPESKDGEMNKTALAREVWAHIAPRDVKEETFIVDLRGGRLSENSAFAKAMNSIPNNTKNK